MNKVGAVSGQQLAQLLQVARDRHMRGALDEAIKIYRQVLKLSPGVFDAIQMLGVAEFQKENYAEAEKLLTRAIKLQPRHAGVHVNLGALYRRIGKPERAVRVYREAIRLNPKLIEAHYNLGVAYYQRGEFERAIETYKQVLALDPGYVEAIVNLGGAYRRAMAPWTLPLECFEKALALNPTLSEPYANIAALFRDREWFHAAKLALDKALILAPHLGKYRAKRAMVQLPAGRLAGGWDDYEFRFESDIDREPKRPGPPYWNCESLVGKKIFIWPEQGLGDQIIYANMLHDLIRCGGEVVCESKSRLSKVFTRSFPGATVVSRVKDTDRVDPGDADYQLALPSLGRFFRRDFASFPRHDGYLKPDPVKTAAIRARYRERAAGRRIVGLSWRSRNEKFGELKSTTLTDWAPILQTEGLMFVNLQYGDCRADIGAVRKQLGIEVFDDPAVDAMGDMDDFFAQVSAMDLVISTSSTTVHVTGSTNVPTWVLLPRGPGALWYWFNDREDSPWYPSVRLFRQRDLPEGRSNVWPELIGRIAAELDRWKAL